jgi:hypothetical protein
MIAIGFDRTIIAGHAIVSAASPASHLLQLSEALRLQARFEFRT